MFVFFASVRITSIIRSVLHSLHYLSLKFLILLQFGYFQAGRDSAGDVGADASTQGSSGCSGGGGSQGALQCAHGGDLLSRSEVKTVLNEEICGRRGQTIVFIPLID